MKHLQYEESSMKIFSQTLSLLFGLALLGALGAGVYFALKYIVGLFWGMNLQVAAVTTIASVVALLAAKIIANSIRHANTLNKVHNIVAEKTTTYQLFIDSWQQLVRQGQALEDRRPTKLSEELQTLDRLLALYGSPGVIKAH